MKLLHNADEFTTTGGDKKHKHKKESHSHSHTIAGSTTAS